MKKYINKLFVICALLFLGVSCENDAILTSLKEVNFSGAIETSTNTVILSIENENESVMTLSWPAVEYPINAPVTYALQFDLPSDTAGATAWGKAIRVEVGVDVLSKAFSGNDLNKMAIKLGLPVDVTGKIVVRVESTMDRTIYSDPIELTVTPYEQIVVLGEIYMPGNYQNFNIATAAALAEIQKGVFQGYITVPSGSGLGFKFNSARNWNQFYGAGVTNSDLVNMSDTDFLLPGEGSFQIKVNTNTLKWTATQYTWGIIGTATAGGWDNSTNMSYDHQLKVWKFKGTLSAGALKFRLNNSWTINYGPKNNTDGIMYLDDQGAYDVSEAGTYEVTFSIAEKDATTGLYPATATYTVTKI
jgi:starch-binding outer membrane protein SusE/F